MTNLRNLSLDEAGQQFNIRYETAQPFGIRLGLFCIADDNQQAKVSAIVDMRVTRFCTWAGSCALTPSNSSSLRRRNSLTSLYFDWKH